MPEGTVITWLRLPASITRYAVMTLVMLPIGRSAVVARLHSHLPVLAFASTAHGAATPAGAVAVACGAAFAIVLVPRSPASVRATAIALVTARTGRAKIGIYLHPRTDIHVFSQKDAAFVVGLKVNFYPERVVTAVG